MVKIIVGTDDIKRRIEPLMSRERYLHTLGVEKAAVWLCAIYGGDIEKMRIAALLHDVAKERSIKEHIEICGKYGISFSALELSEPKTLHQVTGSILAQHEFGVDDGDILSAIRYHTTARADMSLSDKIIYIADYIDETRSYDGVEEMRRLSQKDLDGAVFEALKFTIEALIKKERRIHTDTISAYNCFISKERGNHTNDKS